MIFDLPTPTIKNSRPLAECIGERRSIREYTEGSISIQTLAELLWAAQGVTGSEGERAAPSAGGLYPVGIHIIARRVSGLASGVYAYQGTSHSLKLLSSDIPETSIKVTGIGDQPWLTDAAIIVGISADIDSVLEHFAEQPPMGQRGFRYVYMEVGTAVQNMLLGTTDLGYGGVLVAGFDDLKAKKALMLPSHMDAIALLCIGPHK